MASAVYRINSYDKVLVDIFSPAEFFQLSDEDPPGIPQNVQCSVSDDGTVSVSWDTLTEPDLLGYAVFAGNSEDASFLQVTTDHEEEPNFGYITTLETLTENIYLKVRSSDTRHNYSEFSTVCIAARPDIIPPAGPVLYRLDPTNFGLHIEWIASPSTDVIVHKIQRKREGGLQWSTLVEYGINGTIATGYENHLKIGENGGNLYDTIASHLYAYDFRVLAEDDAGHVTSSEIRTVTPYDSGLRGTITNLQAYEGAPVGFSDPFIGLTWDYDDLEGLHNFLIYRSVDNSPMQAYATTNGRGGINFFNVISGEMGKIIPGQFGWEDLELGVPNVDTGGGAQQGGSTTDIRRYTYRVMARHFDGGFSPLSAVVVISVDIRRQ